MTVDEFKCQLSTLVQENRNQEAMSLVAFHLPVLRQEVSTSDRLMVADWMEGVEMALDLGVDQSAGQARN